MLTTNDVLPCTHVNPFDPTDHETPDEATQWHCPDCGYDCEIPQQDDVEDAVEAADDYDGFDAAEAAGHYDSPAEKRRQRQFGEQ